MTEFSGEAALELGKPLSKELDKAVKELRAPIKDLAKRAEKLKRRKRPKRPAQFFNTFFSQNRERLQRVVWVVRKQASENEDLAKEAIGETLAHELHTTPETSKVIGESLVTAALAKNKKEAVNSLNDTLETTNLGDKDKNEVIELVNQTGRELVPTPEITEAEYEVVEEEAAKPEEIEYSPPGGPPGRPPRGPRGRRPDGGRRERTRAEALRRRGRLPWAAVIFGAAVLGLSLITGQGKPWEGYPISWGFDVAGLAGSGAQEGGARLARGAVEARTEEEINKDATSKSIQKMFAGEKSVGDFLELFIRSRDQNEDLTKPKNYDIAFDPANYNSRMEQDMEVLDDEIKTRDITSDNIAEALEKAGQSQQASKILEDFYDSFISRQPIQPERAKEIRNWFETETGLEWKLIAVE